MKGKVTHLIFFIILVTSVISAIQMKRKLPRAKTSTWYKLYTCASHLTFQNMALHGAPNKMELIRGYRDVNGWDLRQNHCVIESRPMS